MKVKAEDILKPGAVLVTEKIDFDDPKNAELLAYFRLTRMRQSRLRRVTQADYDALKLVITI